MCHVSIHKHDFTQSNASQNWMFKLRQIICLITKMQREQAEKIAGRKVKGRGSLRCSSRMAGDLQWLIKMVG